MNALTKLMITVIAIVLLGRHVQAQSQRPLMYASRECNEYAMELRLDPRPFQDFVGPDFSLALMEGKARVVIVVHDCSQLWIDGYNLGPAQEVRVWVAIRGLDDVRPVVGAEQTPPTRTWFTLFEGSSNSRVREVKTAAVIAERPVDSVFLDSPGPRQGGRVYLNGNLAFSWRVPSPVAPSARLIGLNHDVYRRDSTGSVVLNRIQALMHVSADSSPGTLKVMGREGVVPLISPGTYPVSVRMFFPMWSRATLGLSPGTH
ncbi:MAG: hypothetical protein M1470_12780 [Bacteroidetes bacterium]|nr:hypothetical protein [Bacteroidota bacterium]MCL5738866.1 hypothetical protein [Bacteroidota bacterium]